MINRYYICDACDYAFCVQQELHDEKRLKRCPQCKRHKLYQDLTGQHTFIYQEPKTVGHLAHRNTERAGKYELEAVRRNQQIAKDKPKLDKLKKIGLAKESDEVIDRRSIINPEGKDIHKELRPLITEKNRQVRAKKINDYIIEGKI